MIGSKLDFFWLNIITIEKLLIRQDKIEELPVAVFKTSKSCCWAMLNHNIFRLTISKPTDDPLAENIYIDINISRSPNSFSNKDSVLRCKEHRFHNLRSFHPARLLDLLDVRSCGFSHVRAFHARESPDVNIDIT